MVKRSVGVTTIWVHLPEQRPVFERDQNGNAVERGASQLQRYFSRPQGVAFDRLLILDYFELYVVGAVVAPPPNGDGSGMMQTHDNAVPPRRVSRRAGLHAARLGVVPPTATELYFLRLLLLNRPARTYEQLRLLPGAEEPCATFGEACVELGLIDADGGEYARCFRDAVRDAVTTPAALRHLFVTLVMFGGMENDGAAARQLLDEHETSMYDDYRRDVLTRHNVSLDDANAPPPAHDDRSPLAQVLRSALVLSRRKLLSTLIQLFGDRGMDNARDVLALTEQDLPMQVAERGASRACTPLSDESIALIVAKEKLYWRGRVREQIAIDADVALLNQQQRRLFDHVLARVTAVESGAVNSQQLASLFVLNGSAGVGKTFTARIIAEQMRRAEKIVLIAASTGIAACMFDGALTAHRLFKLPVTDSSDLAGTFASMLTSRHDSWHLLKNASLLLWDECFAMHNRVFGAVSSLLQQVREAPGVLFGGIPTILIGDARQVAPIVPGEGNEAAIRSASLQSTAFWHASTRVTLWQSMRQADDTTFARYLQRVGDGQRTPCDDDNDDMVGEFQQLSSTQHRVPILPSISRTDDAVAFVSRLFPDVNDSVACARSAIVCSLIRDTVTWNALVLRRLPGATIRVASATRVLQDTGEARVLVGDRHRARSNDAFTDEYLQTVQPSGIPPHLLCFKPGMTLVLIRNLSPKDHLMNGTKLVLRRVINQRILVVQRVSPIDGTLSEMEHHIPRLPFTFKLPRSLTNIRRRQFPVLPAYAITVHRAQCQTLSAVGIDNTVSMFGHGMLFVALSRARAAGNVTVYTGESPDDAILRQQRSQPQRNAAPPPPNNRDNHSDRLLRKTHFVNIVYRSLLDDVLKDVARDRQQHEQRQQQQ